MLKYKNWDYLKHVIFILNLINFSFKQPVYAIGYQGSTLTTEYLAMVNMIQTKTTND